MATNIMFKKIVTHAGVFHADELSAIAILLKMFPGAPVERTYTPSEADFSDPSVIVLDIGRRYEPTLNNYDHHQSTELPAANMLILRHFFSLENPRLAELLEKHFFAYISDVDTGKVVEGAATAPTINSIIRCCNNLPEETGFSTALCIMSAALEAQIETAKQRIASEEIWKTVSITGQVAVHDSPDFIVGWHELAEECGVNFLVTPNLRGGYQITSRDSKAFPIPADPRQTFLHNSQFIAAYASLKDAIDHAHEIAGKKFLCWGFNAGILEISAIDEADALAQITQIEWDTACAYGTNAECGIVAEKEHFLSAFGEKETQAELEQISARKAKHNAMPRDKEWLLDTIYDHVAWHEYGIGKRFLHYKEQVETLYSPGMASEEVEALRKSIIGY